MEVMAPAAVLGNASEVPVLAKRPEKPDGRAGTMKLTRKAVLSRAKATSLGGVRKLNCWGSHISDISICRELPNVEVVTFRCVLEQWLPNEKPRKTCGLSFSMEPERKFLLTLEHSDVIQNHKKGLQTFGHPVVLGFYVAQRIVVVNAAFGFHFFSSANNISSLEPINQCQKLTELYLRRNCISNLHELFHLKKLPCLRILWMSENPCCGSDLHHYRMTVLRNLPSLYKLDNKMVTEEELSHALSEGEEITTPPVKTDVDSCCQYSNTESSTTEPTTENELTNFSLEETNKIREQLGMKPVVPRDKFSSQEVGGNQKKRNNILSAIMLLLEELDSEGLEVLHQTVGNKLQALQKKELHEDR